MYIKIPLLTAVMPAKTGNALRRLNVHTLAECLRGSGFHPRSRNKEGLVTFAAESSPLEFIVRVDPAMILTSEKAYAQVWIGYRAPDRDLQPSAQELDFEMGLKDITCSRILDGRNGVHGGIFTQGYQIGVPAPQDTETVLGQAVRYFVAYTHGHVSRRAQQK
jgi:hypothetical protein